MAIGAEQSLERRDFEGVVSEGWTGIGAVENDSCVALCADAVVSPIAAGGGAELRCGFEADLQQFHSPEVMR